MKNLSASLKITLVLSLLTFRNAHHITINNVINNTPYTVTITEFHDNTLRNSYTVSQKSIIAVNINLETNENLFEKLLQDEAKNRLLISITSNPAGVFVIADGGLVKEKHAIYSLWYQKYYIPPTSRKKTSSPASLRHLHTIYGSLHNVVPLVNGEQEEKPEAVIKAVDLVIQESVLAGKNITLYCQ